MPTYNNATFIKKVIEDLIPYCDDIFIINDGSTDNTLDIIKPFSTINIISYPINKGKGYALRTCFKNVLDAGFNYAITIDSDGQHFAKDLPVFLEALDRNSNSIIIGSRSLKNSNISSKSNFANKFSNFWFNIETGVELPDTQSGYRLYPLKEMKSIKFFSGKYEFELEIIVRASWANIDVLCVPIDVYYPEKENRISHFRPFKDFLRISLLNIVLVTMALIYYRPKKILNVYRKKTFKQIIKEDILDVNTSNHIIASSIAFGVFMGIVPIWGFQLIIGFIIAHFFKLNKAIFFLAANISFPPLLPIILYLSYITGSYVLENGSWNVDVELSIEGVKANLKQYLIGSIVFAFMLSVFFGLFSFLLLKLFRKK